MSERKPGKNTMVGPRPSRRTQASSVPLPRSSRPVVSGMKSILRAYSIMRTDESQHNNIVRAVTAVVG
jgi:hypothetical protein